MPPRTSHALDSNAVSEPAPPDLAIPLILDPEDEPDSLELLNSVDWTNEMLRDAYT